MNYEDIHNVRIYVGDDKEPVFSLTYDLNDKSAEKYISETMEKLKTFYGNLGLTKIDSRVYKIEKVQ